MNVGFTYEIRDKTNTDLVYYGSSELPSLEDRMKYHLKDFKYWKKNNDADYCYSFKVLEPNNYKATLLKIIFFTIKWELREQERHLIEYQTCVNHNVPNRTKAEYYQDNKEKIKEYYQDNKEKIKERHADYYQANIEQRKEYLTENKEKIKEQKAEHYQENKEKFKERHADYYQANIENLKEKKNEKFNCPCGGKYTYSNKTLHNKSKRHQNWLKTQE